MKSADQIPYYAPDGTSLGFRSLGAAKRLIAGGYVKTSYGRKGHLKAIWLQREDGSNPIDAQAHAGTRYSFLEHLDSGRCWKLRRLDRRDDDGVPVWSHEVAACEKRRAVHRIAARSVQCSKGKHAALRQSAVQQSSVGSSLAENSGG